MYETYTAKIDEFEQAYETLITVAEQYPEDLKTQAGVTGTWSAREVLAHLCGWLAEAKRRYPRYGRGAGEIKYEIDNFNAVSIRMREGKEYDQILDELRTSVEQLTTMARAITEQKYQRDGRYINWLNILLEEAENHTAQLQAFAEA